MSKSRRSKIKRLRRDGGAADDGPDGLPWGTPGIIVRFLPGRRAGRLWAGSQPAQVLVSTDRSGPNDRRDHFASAIASTLKPPTTRLSRLWVTWMSAFPEDRLMPRVNG
jgi:hypothetical protein